MIRNVIKSFYHLCCKMMIWLCGLGWVSVADLLIDALQKLGIIGLAAAIYKKSLDGAAIGTMLLILACMLTLVIHRSGK